MKMDMKNAKGESPIPGGNAVDSKLNGAMRLKTVGVKPDGTTVLVMETLSGKVTTMGQEMPVPKSPPLTMEVAKNGVSKLRGLEKQPGAAAMSQFFDANNVPSLLALLPDHPIKIGEAWENTIPSPLGDGTVTVNSTLLGVETINGQETLKIKQSMTFPFKLKMDAGGKPIKGEGDPAMTMTGSGTVNSVMYILEATARVIKSVEDTDVKFEMKMFGAAAQQNPLGDQMTMTMGSKMSMTFLNSSMVTDKQKTPKPVTPAKKATPNPGEKP